MIIKPTLFASPQKQTTFLKSFVVLEIKKGMIFHVNSLLVDDSYAISRSIISLKFKSVQCNLSCQIDVLRVKIKVTLCMLDKFIFCHLYHIQFNIKTILGTSPVRLFGHV